MDDLEEITKSIDVLIQDKPLDFLGHCELKTGCKLLIIDLLINFNRLEVHLKRLVTYVEIPTYKDEVRTLPLSQLINVKELHKYLNGEIIYLLGKVEKNLFVRNLIAHSIPTLIKDKYIVFLSHDISELKKIRINAKREDYKYAETERTKALLKLKEKIDHSNYSVMRLNDLIGLNELLDYLIKEIEFIVNHI
ncbi:MULTISPECIES: hypothetical protein [Acinetobacter]|uniref:hypothetical protein n=1 Tax=Acinetobacter TaxID=469 RepID=UPI002684410C|nr:hypothetical protein [Acinetobacter sp.]